MQRLPKVPRLCWAPRLCRALFWHGAARARRLLERNGFVGFGDRRVSSRICQPYQRLRALCDLRNLARSVPPAGRNGRLVLRNPMHVRGLSLWVGLVLPCLLWFSASAFGQTYANKGGIRQPIIVESGASHRTGARNWNLPRDRDRNVLKTTENQPAVLPWHHGLCHGGEGAQARDVRSSM